MSSLIKQHLIDPEICIRCNTCEATCPVGAISHDSRNYVVDAAVCNGCMACVPPCPTGAIDNWREMPRDRAYGIAAQFSWDTLPAGEAAAVADAALASAREGAIDAEAPFNAATYGATVAPASASRPATNLHSAAAPLLATVAGNFRVTDAGAESDTHHVVLDLGSAHFPLLEGQSIGIVAPGCDAEGRAHHPRQYSVASPRNGERAGYNNVSLTVKRVTADHDGRPVRGVCSNYVCDLKVGDTVAVTGPFGASFLMPNRPAAPLVMICTGTGSAPMRAMTEWRRRNRASTDGRLMLFFGARTQRELPYFGPLMSLPRDFMDVNLAFSRTPGQPRRYVQDVMRERAADVAALVADPQAFIYVCGLKAMEEGVLRALRDVALEAALDWPALAAALKREGRLHLETY
jgi:benzoyl-CoA 2,3-dioxygenase component A